MVMAATRIISTLVDFCCPRCGALLCRIKLTAGSSVEAKCDRCKIIVTKEAA